MDQQNNFNQQQNYQPPQQPQQPPQQPQQGYQQPYQYAPPASAKPNFFQTLKNDRGETVAKLLGILSLIMLIAAGVFVLITLGDLIGNIVNSLKYSFRSDVGFFSIVGTLLRDLANVALYLVLSGISLGVSKIIKNQIK